MKTVWPTASHGNDARETKQLAHATSGLSTGVQQAGQNDFTAAECRASKR